MELRLGTLGWHALDCSAAWPRSLRRLKCTFRGTAGGRCACSKPRLGTSVRQASASPTSMGRRRALVRLGVLVRDHPKAATGDEVAGSCVVLAGHVVHEGDGTAAQGPRRCPFASRPFRQTV
jgi:hypothetical protein